MPDKNVVSVVVNDPCPGAGLETIFPIAARARSFVARKKTHPILAGNFWRIWGVVDMLERLEYHHGNFTFHIEHLSEIETLTNRSPFGDEPRRALRHEFIAYLNCVGQLYYFAESAFVEQRVPNVRDLVPTIFKFTPFRHKHGAHRSIDAPHKEDDDYTQQLQAWQLSSFGGLPFEGKKERTTLDRNPLWNDYYIGLQMLIEKPDKFENFYLEREHPAISWEVFTLLERLLN